MKRIILIFFLAISQIANSQNSFLSGSILLDDGYPAVGANIYIKELNLGAISDFNGNYNLSNISNGTFDVTISFIGYESISKEITFKDNNIQN